jgi:hypothetical protein
MLTTWRSRQILSDARPTKAMEPKPKERSRIVPIPHHPPSDGGVLYSRQMTIANSTSGSKASRPRANKFERSSQKPRTEHELTVVVEWGLLLETHDISPYRFQQQIDLRLLISSNVSLFPTRYRERAFLHGANQKHVESMACNQISPTTSKPQPAHREDYSSSSISAPPSPPPPLRFAIARRFTRPGRPPPNGELRAKSMCFWESMRTINDGTFTSCFPTRMWRCLMRTRA